MKKVRILAVVAAVITAVAVYLFIENLNKPTMVQTTSVVIAKEDIKADTIITSDMLAVVEYPSEAVHSEAASRISEVTGKMCNSQIVKDEQIITTLLIEPGESNETLAYAIESGQRAITLSVDDVSGVAGLLRPQDHVDVLLTIEIEEQPEPTVVQPEPNAIKPEPSAVQPVLSVIPNQKTYSIELLQNIKVLAVGISLNKNDLSANGYSTVTLSVSPEQAIKLNLAAESGKIRLTLRSPLDSDMAETQSISVSALLQ